MSTSSPQPESGLTQALLMPWKARNEIERLLILPFAWMSAVGAGAEWGAGWKLYGFPIWQIHRRSTLRIGARLSLRSTWRSNPLGPNRPCIISTRSAGATLLIGDDFGMTGGSLVCAERIEIGNRVNVGCNSIIADTDFHPLDPQARQLDINAGATAPVVVEDDVFIGMQCLILKGVRLGAGCVVGAGSVVTRDVPPRAIVAGNPARVVKAL
jgi:acetyltransferase-like isoleucine patch superfamily enzyme